MRLSINLSTFIKPSFIFGPLHSEELIFGTHSLHNIELLYVYDTDHSSLSFDINDTIKHLNSVSFKFV